MALSSRQTLQPLRRLLRLGDAQPTPDPWNAIDLSHTFKSGVTVSIRSMSDWYVFNEVFVEADYDPAIDLLTRRSDKQTRPLVLDLGANVGYFAARVVDRLTIQRAGEYADLILVEGSPTVFRQLEERIPGMAVGDFAVSATNALVGQREGSGTISEVEFGARNTMMPSHNAGISPLSQMSHHEVSFVDLAALVGSRRIALLKCDVEGSEQRFVETYLSDLLPRTDAAVFELHHRLCDVPRCLEILSDCGLELVSSVDQKDETSLVLLARKVS
jgi:FkbM family methyltransferase